MSTDAKTAVFEATDSTETAQKAEEPSPAPKTVCRGGGRSEAASLDDSFVDYTRGFPSTLRAGKAEPQRQGRI